MPSIITTDLRVDKTLNFKNKEVSLFVIVNNLLNIRNVADIFETTGKPDDNGSFPIYDSSYYESLYQSYLKHNEDYKSIYNYTSGLDMYNANKANWKAYCADPYNYLNPRIIRVGVEFRF
jgi:hypothetical protein